MTRFLNFILVLLLLSSCDDISSSSSEKTYTFFPSVKNTETLQLELDIESKEIESLDSLKAQFKLKNISAKELTYGFPSGCQYGYAVLQNENMLFDSRENLLCTGALTQLKLQPNETKSFPISLDRFDVDKELDKGSYQLKAFLLEDHGVEITASFNVE